MVKTLLTLILGMFLCSQAFAYCVGGFCMGVKDEVIKSVYPTAGGQIYLEAPADKHELNCDLVEGYYMLLNKEHPLFEVSYSTILTALTAGKRLQVRVIEGSSDFRVAYVRMWN